MRDEFTIMRQGKKFVLFAGLLDEAHNKGLSGIDTELIQTPDDSNAQTAIVKAVVDIENTDGQKTFSGIGDASPENVSRNIVPHLIRMAETRAKARALRDAINIDTAVLEDSTDETPAAQPATSTASTNGGSVQHSRLARNNRNERPENGTNRSDNVSSSDSAQTNQNAQETKSTPTEAAEDNVRSISNAQDGRARKSTIDFLRTLAEEWRGENAVERLEKRIGKSLSELSESEAQHWVDKLTPKEDTDEAAIAASGEE